MMLQTLAKTGGLWLSAEDADPEAGAWTCGFGRLVTACRGGRLSMVVVVMVVGIVVVSVVVGSSSSSSSSSSGSSWSGSWTHLAIASSSASLGFYRLLQTTSRRNPSSLLQNYWLNLLLRRCSCYCRWRSWSYTKSCWYRCCNYCCYHCYCCCLYSETYDHRPLQVLTPMVRKPHLAAVGSRVPLLHSLCREWQCVGRQNCTVGWVIVCYLDCSSWGPQRCPTDEVEVGVRRNTRCCCCCAAPSAGADPHLHHWKEK